MTRPAKVLRGERGAAAALVALFLPCLLAAAALVIDAGVLLVARAQVAAAADLEALAGVQDLDYVLLAEGRVVILAEAAIADATAWVAANLGGQPFFVPGSVRVTVAVCNIGDGSGEGQSAFPVTGKGPHRSHGLRGGPGLGAAPLSAPGLARHRARPRRRERGGAALTWAGRVGLVGTGPRGKPTQGTGRPPVRHRGLPQEWEKGGGGSIWANGRDEPESGAELAG